MEPRIACKVVVDKAPNRLFVKYLTEWKDQAKERGDKSVYTYKKALKSLQRYPLPLQCGEEAKILENIGDKICKMLDKRLQKDAEENDVSPSEFLAKSRKVPENWWTKVNKNEAVTAKKPAKRKKVAQNNPEVVKRSKNQQTISQAFGLSEENSEGTCTDSQQSSSNSSCAGDTFTLRPGTFEVVLCVDTRETMGEKKKRDIKVELGRQNIRHDQRTLNLGDFTWIAREKDALSPRELVLDFIVERKILSDLSKSIQDGRFHEQKWRLKNSGIKNIVYLIENMNGIGNQSLPEQTLRQAIYNTQIVDRISVKYTKNAAATISYLDSMTEQLKKLYENCTLMSTPESDSQEFVEVGTHRLVTFRKFNESGCKQRKLTVKELFLRQLMQIHGMSYDKASSITSVYGTPMSLIRKYETLPTDAEREALLSKVKFGLNGRNLGVAMSRAVYALFS